MSAASWSALLPIPDKRSITLSFRNGISTRRFAHDTFAVDEIGACADHMVGVRLKGTVRAERKLFGRWRETETGRGSITVLPANQTSGWRLKGTGVMLHLFVPPAVLEALLADEDGRPASALAFADRFGEFDIDLAMLAERFVAESEGDRVGGLLMSEGLLLQVVALLGRRHAGSSNARLERLSRASRQRLEDFLRANLTGNISVAEMADVAKFSVSRFGPAFRETFGTTPRQYIIRCRLEVATTLLGTGMPIAEIAVAAGFCHQAHLTAAFRKAFGLTPACYRTSLCKRARDFDRSCNIESFFDRQPLPR